MPHHGAVYLEDTHAYKQQIKSGLGGDAGIGDLLQNKGQTNFDFWVADDGTIWISDNGQGGQGVATQLNFFVLFPEHAPKPVEIPEQQRSYDLPPSDDEDDEPRIGDIFTGADGQQMFRAADGQDYPVHTDAHGNTYYQDASGTAQWTHP